ncbi:PREDICTED: extracellular matrix protein 2-like [Nanorana parkeri]|uniref:extracellular matrix protein 2-like n=1 Tax=Nanorana parkeri TaxID=125878 RepID=UPI0008548563|nr:PREDICTED: extracellular matrix protein 2-like [Nanorana parkeri]
MKLLLVALMMTLLGCAGRAQKPQGNGIAGVQRAGQKASNSKHVEAGHSPPAQKVLKETSSRQRKAVVPAIESPLVAAQGSQSDVLHNYLPGRGQCLVNGMIMYEGAAWSPRQCTICICTQGKQVCEPVDCEDVTCPSGRLQIPPGGCCPVCMKPETTKPTLVVITSKAIPGKATEQRKDTKTTKAKDPIAPVVGPNTTRHNSSTTVKPQKLKKTTAANDLEDVTKAKPVTKKKELDPEKQETSLQKTGATIPKPKKKSIGEKGLDIEPVKNTEQEQPKEGMANARGVNKTCWQRARTSAVDNQSSLPGKGVAESQVAADSEKKKHKAVSSGTAQPAGTQKPKILQEDKTKKPVEANPLPSLPTVLSVTPPTPHHIPSLPSGCLLSEFTIACGNTKMTYLPLMTDLGLKTLYLAENEISKLPARGFAGLPNLEWLDLSKNKLDDSGLAFDVFKNLTMLKRLNLDGNRLSVLPLLPSSLLELKVNDNNLRELNRHSFRGLSNLLNLELEGNGFHDGNVSPLSFKPLKKLIYLRLNRNQFRAVTSGLPSTLQELHLENNRIEAVHEGILNKTLNLSIIALSNNRLMEDGIAPRAWIHLMNVESLDLSHNRLVHVPSFLPRGLKQLILHHNHIELIPGYVFAHMKPGLEFLHLSHNHLRDDGIHAVSFFGLYKSLTELLLDNNYLQTIPRGILNLKSLQALRLSFNKIRYVPLNSICDTRISEDSSLVSVHLENNYINRRHIPPTAFSCIKTYYSIVLRPQIDEYEDY